MWTITVNYLRHFFSAPKQRGPCYWSAATHEGSVGKFAAESSCQGKAARLCVICLHLQVSPPTPPTRPCHHSSSIHLSILLLLLFLSAPHTDFSQSDGPTGLSSHGQQSDPPRLPEPRLQPQQRCPGAGHHADRLPGQMEQEDGFSLVCHRICGGLGKCLEVSVHLLPKRRR